MHTTVQEPVAVLSFTSAGKMVPLKLRWRGKVYPLTQVGLHYTARRGRTLYHLFSASDGSTCFSLSLDSERLTWTLEAVSDGLPD